MDTPTRRLGAHILLEALESEGVEYIFGNPGTTELPLMDALIGRQTIHYVLGLQEACVVAMADGYAQASGKPGFINLHTAGGLGHGLGNLLNACTSGTPLVVTAGQQDSRHAISDPLLQGDLVAIATPVAKWAMEVSTPEQIPILIRRAFQDSHATPSGPVFLSLPMNVMEAMSEVEIPKVSRVDRRPVASSLPELAKELAAYAPGKVAIIAGDEISLHDACKEVVELAELLAAPVFGSSWPAHIPYPTSHYLWQGNLPTKAAAIAEAISDADCVFALGGKSFITILYTDTSALPAGCELYQLSVDGNDLGRTYPTKLSVVGDIQYSLKQLNLLLRAQVAGRQADFEAQRERAREASAARRQALMAEADALFDRPVIHPLVAARELALAIGDETPIIDEALATASHLRKFLNNSSTRQYSFMRGGALGWGMPAAVGFSLGIGRGPVVSLVGDGAAMYSPQALWTAVNERLPVTFVVINNREYNILKNFMRSQPHYTSAQTGRFVAMEINDPPIDFLALATAMGMPSQRIERAEDIRPRVSEAVASNRPNLIEIVVAAE
ncbi:MAG: thiamine pyrophosphate-binding protein [Rhodocyclaceae bacterium]|nr:thiamine pyrophosphate-binding protein [Rhodocyclaceae bacterium]MCP5233633.1 thiamine pyrophosphate-binding protein [Zoogloeaceae bacterium]MCB1912864.1 thiamine pyrophosphate-binding protein [Rhodocyclaceae bacterium]MCP5239399.1 thiamine pyrophosphate-binding protein [Zoogloeaceae bacterium]MCP5255563.1 thiamine pyrophosphate-binding protein [Zoogloeaceae bacterium]